jgi:signal transduction histidine kinase
VFDRFYRADNARSAGGAGLGLAIVRSIVELHGGSVEVASEPGRGTRVRMTFPARTAAPASS